ncbi:G-type lectin S-receptor-like serine/threonine-protein kinase SD2-5 [Cryptomeria japonica]|uniref:G-type lectin S-receptor-like serine/threonine-protein kinase SD2-5 n=1 Tax=Cryptomeria japonica TaxID=3369 RepID=UPI0025ACD54B|nr:G-type lectin S-receptor-like serine/threonine-protein kinase SD2-5 [Cryptomeria japonica]
MITDFFLSSPPLLSLLLPLFLISCSLFAESLAITSTAAYEGRTWRNNIQSLHFLTPSIYKDALVRPILLSSNISYNDVNLQFGCGFFCYGSPCDTSYLFATFFVVYTTDGMLLDMQMVWCANRDQMVQENAALTLTSTGELVLRNSDGTLVWSTNTSPQAFQRMAIHESGNLVLYNTSGGIIWQSFDYTTDTSLPGQKFKVGQKITANISPKDTRKGRFYGILNHDGFALYTASAPSKMYFRYPEAPVDVELTYSVIENESNNIYSRGQRIPPIHFTVPKGLLYFKLASDGHFKFCTVHKNPGRSVLNYSPWFMKSVLLCDSPGACGDYGVCKNGQCSCPGDGNAFKPTDAAEPNSGCAPRVPLVCSQTSRRQGHHFLELEHVAYFTYLYENASTSGLVSRDECKTLCLENCSCKAAFFRYGTNFSSGYCYLESNIYSMTTMSPVDKFYNSTAYIKIQSTSKRFKSIVVIIICVSVGGAVALFILFWARIKGSQNRRQQKVKDEDTGEDDVDWSAGLPLRFSFQELQHATNGFNIKLGSGGFGSVYQGVLSDGSKIAVKRLHRAGHGEKGFRVEVETLGKIDHLNLVRLKGFCAEKFHRMLVYEYLPNGSLDKWIFFNKSHPCLLDWKSRSRVVLDIARGLAYLHEECQERIIHFDIKPQNILLDQNFNAKVSDFGLAKLINREQSEVITMIRGTPGYMAPELLNMHITEKADIFSFGVMVIEIVSGKRSRELSENGLFSLLQVKAEEGRLLDLVYPGLENEETGIKEEAIKLIKVGMWCVQDNFTRRPAMSIVVKALEGLIDTFNDVPCASPGSTVRSYRQTLLSAELSVLSGPR